MAANLKRHFIEEIKDKELLCAEITIRHAIDNTKALLKIGFTDDDLDVFLNEIDCIYDNSYRSRDVDAIIWYKDKTWSETGKYDTGDWWTYHKMPTIPIYLK